jgi:hypothetical protein
MKKNVLFVSMALLASSLMAQNTIDNAFFDKVNFRGAFGTTDWTSGWANYDPQNKVYPATTATIAAGNITTNTTLGSPLRAAASFADASLANPFFTPVDYIGAFGTTDWTAGWSNFDPQNKIYAATDVTIAAGNITTNTTWTKNHVYLLTGYVFVNSGVTLTIEPGTVIRGDKASKATLIISQGGKLVANGTVSEPIVFTSNQPVGSRAAGDWGGVILLGKAPINPVGGTATIEGGVGLSAIYGGTDAADNSGSLQYVRIEFPGVAYATDNEINGLTMGGVGSGTTIDNIEVIYSGDDSYEWFGGTVNCKHLIAIAGVDDDFDTDFGYSGMVQFAVGLRHPLIDDQSASGTSNGFESDNNAAGDAVSPYTSAVFCNVSEFGPLATPSTTISNHFGRAMHIRRNSKLKIFNSVFAGWKTGLYIDGVTTQANAVAGDLKIKNCVLAGMTVANFGVPASQTWDVAAETAWFNTAGFGNSTFTNNTDLLVSNPFSLTSPNFTTTTPSYLLSGYVFVNDGVTLSIKPGTIIRGDKASKATLIVSQGAKLIANGTVSEPIVFTSNQPVGSRAAGDWGGVILLGKAPINPVGGTATIEGGVGLSAIYGGTDAADNSGSLKYMRIEFPGIAYATDNEINGLTFGGVGSGTTIDNIQVSYSGDDSYEWFGGTVNCKHLVAIAGVDDDFDTDFGYSGMIQYAVGLRNPMVDDQSASGTSNGFESDNNAAGDAVSPYTSAVFSNFSLFGPLATPTTTISNHFGRAMHIRRNSKLQVYNSIFAGWKTGLYVDGITTQANAVAGDLKVRNSVLAGMTVANFGVPASQTWDVAAETAWYNTASFKNETAVANTDLKVVDPFTLTAPNFTLKADSKLNNQSYWFFKAQTGTYSMPVVAKVLVNGAEVSASGSTLLAFKNGVCVGSAEINTANNQFSLSVAANATADSNYDLKLYEASTKTVYNLPTSFDFNNASSFGTVSAPIQLKATASLTIPLNKNANWISFNVLPTDNSVANVLNYTASNDDLITSQNANATYYNGAWYGTITGLEKNKMYKLVCASNTPGSIQITNQPLVKNTPISLVAGYNWIGSSLIDSYAVSTALSGISLSDENFITTQSEKGGTATYYGNAWFPGTYTVAPGVGYVVKSTNASTFDFPGNTLSTPNKVKATETTPVAPWTALTGLNNTMPIYAQINKNSVSFQPSGVLLGVFKAGQCYGYSGLTAGPGGIMLHNITMGCNNETESGFSYKVYDPTNGSYYDITETAAFANLQPVGKIYAPVQLNISGLSTDVATSKVQSLNIYPNPVENVCYVSFYAGETAVSAELSLLDMQGRLIKTLYNGNVAGNAVVKIERDNTIDNGLYILKAKVGNSLYTQKLFLK